MQFQKRFGKIVDMKLSVEERRALQKEINRQTAEIARTNERERDAIILYILHFEFGFGEKRLRKFFDSAQPLIEELLERYEMNETDTEWLCLEKLRQDGIDISKWYKENET